MSVYKTLLVGVSENGDVMLWWYTRLQNKHVMKVGPSDVVPDSSIGGVSVKPFKKQICAAVST